MAYEEIKLAIFDCDGVFTDGRIIYDDHRVEAKNFDAKDGMGLKILQFSGIKLAMITGRSSNVVAQRCLDLKFDYVYQGVWKKRAVAEKIMEEMGISWENVAYMGDDWNDYPVIKMAGLSAAPADAFADFKERVDFVCTRAGGRGAIREFVEYLLHQQNRYQEVIDEFLKALEDFSS